MIKKTYKINGMDCASCASLIELDFEDAGVKASCSYPKETLEVEYDEKIFNEEKVKAIVIKSGYNIN